MSGAVLCNLDAEFSILVKRIHFYKSLSEQGGLDWNLLQERQSTTKLKVLVFSFSSSSTLELQVPHFFIMQNSWLSSSVSGISPGMSFTITTTPHAHANQLINTCEDIFFRIITYSPLPNNSLIHDFCIYLNKYIVLEFNPMKC